MRTVNAEVEQFMAGLVKRNPGEPVDTSPDTSLTRCFRNFIPRVLAYVQGGLPLPSPLRSLGPDRSRTDPPEACNTKYTYEFFNCGAPLE